MWYCSNFQGRSHKPISGWRKFDILRTTHSVSIFICWSASLIMLLLKVRIFNMQANKIQQPEVFQFEPCWVARDHKNHRCWLTWMLSFLKYIVYSMNEWHRDRCCSDFTEIVWNISVFKKWKVKTSWFKWQKCMN